MKTKQPTTPLAEVRKRLGKPVIPDLKPVTFYGTMTCQKCYQLALIVLGVGADGYRLDRVESNCNHLPNHYKGEVTG